MASQYLSSLNNEQRLELTKRLHESQKGKCFICQQLVDLTLHQYDIDHIEPLAVGGKDSTDNLALTHRSCNRSKQASHLQVARLLARFSVIREEAQLQGPNRPNLGDLMGAYHGAQHCLPLQLADSQVRFSFPDLGDNQVHTVPLYHDELSDARYFFAVLPIEYLFHDERINPRAIGGNLKKLLEEFFRKRPQLHVSLAWATLDAGKRAAKVYMFDGQHKAAAQVLLGVRRLPVRVFLNPDMDILLTANTNAGTVLRQVAFDQSVRRYLGSELYRERLDRYQKAHGRPEDFFAFSEKDLVQFFRGEAREIRRYVLDDVRASVTHHSENALKDFIDLGGRGQERPLSYNTIERTVFSMFICRDMLETPLDLRLDIGENPRQLEKEQLVRLLNTIAEEVYTGRFDPSVGTRRIEKRIVDGNDQDITDDHLRACRMSREEIMHNWLKFVRLAIRHFYLVQRIPIMNEGALFQRNFPEPLWDTVRGVIRSVANIPLWVNRSLASTAFGGKQSRGFWGSVFETGQTPSGVQVLATSVDLNRLLEG